MTSIQIGLYPERRAIFDGIYHREEGLFNLLRSPCTREDVDQWARTHRIDDDRAAKIWNSVQGSGLVLEKSLPMGMSAAEYRAASRAGTLDPVAASRTAVEIHGLGLVGVLLALNLNLYGLASIHVTDPSPVTESQARWLGSESFGKPCDTAVRPRLRPARQEDPATTIIVAVSSRTYPRHIARKALAEDVPLLPIVIAEADIQIGPFVTGSPCIECVESARSKEDEAWPHLTDQAARFQRLEADTASAFQAVSWVVGEIMHLINHPELEPRLHSSILHIPPPPGWPYLEPVEPFPRCGCDRLDL